MLIDSYFTLLLPDINGSFTENGVICDLKMYWEFFLFFFYFIIKYNIIINIIIFKRHFVNFVIFKMLRTEDQFKNI